MNLGLASSLVSFLFLFPHFCFLVFSSARKYPCFLLVQDVPRTCIKPRSPIFMHYPYPFKCFFIIPRVPILKGGLVLLRTHWHLAPGKLNCNFVRGFPVCLIPVSLFFLSRYQHYRVRYTRPNAWAGCCVWAKALIYLFA